MTGPETDAAVHLVERIAAARGHLLRTAERVPADRWETVPPGFSNHVLWNVAHVVVTLELLTYGRCGLELAVPPALVAQARKGTSPADWDAPPDRDAVLELATDSTARLARDIGAGWFTAYEPYDTSAGVRLASLADALAFDLYHEGLHAGAIQALARALG